MTPKLVFSFRLDEKTGKWNCFHMQECVCVKDTPEEARQWCLEQIMETLGLSKMEVKDVPAVD